ncbi:MAG: hypothetical protein KQJ78_21025 [Deltaproteobacteria bacterium]|nr:hypothetical protein [Deltaproteobacteria bacterium]
MDTQASLRRVIAQAEDLFCRFGSEILEEPALHARVDAYRQEITNTWRLVKEAGWAADCAVCALSVSGSCCFDGVEKWFDFRMILINLLLGVELPTSREVAGQCFFIGPQGCKLIARNSICINHFCPPVLAKMGQEEVQTFRQLTGREIWAGVELERVLDQWLAGQGA